ncbi:methylated-DNA--[protein]-cysteine S-methyltransferase [Celeribacter sp.]|uniref:methylated-DNA--[protein]-cysteine S-methyltransferase n=1 Tax=Celeribacter sp. TaxID=1890673 RepID=UPI003A915193
MSPSPPLKSAESSDTALSDHYHYGVIRRAIEVIDAADVPLSLDELARQLGMSAPHFQRVFSRWAGVSPKRYQQYLTLDLAKSLMQTRRPLDEVADASGLSGTGRLHDLFIRWEAMTPGEFARAGDGVTIRFGWIATPFGEALAMATTRGLCGLGFVADRSRDDAFADMTARWPDASFVEDTDAVAPLVESAMRGQHTRVHLIGAPFQIKVWEALLSIPAGSVTTYSDIAERIGAPKASRAVGTAVGRNPVAWLIPCHRVLRKSGALGGYHWGLPVKRALLAYESARHDARIEGQ